MQLIPVWLSRRVHFKKEADVREFESEEEPISIAESEEWEIPTKLMSNHVTVDTGKSIFSEIFPVWLFGKMGARALAKFDVPAEIALAGVKNAEDDFGMMIRSSRNAAVISMYQVGAVYAYQQFLQTRHV
jgi:hypothetical protein